MQTDEEIQKMFIDYVSSKEDEPRHLPVVRERMKEFSDAAKEIIGDDGKRIDLTGTVIDVGVAFEESGFVAGFRYAMSMKED